MILAPGEQVYTRINTSEIAVNKTPNLEQVMAWKNDRFYFENADLQTVMRQLARWYDVEIVYEGHPPTRHFEGEIPMNALASEVLNILEKNNIHFRISGNKIIVKGE